MFNTELTAKHIVLFELTKTSTTCLCSLLGLLNSFDLAAPTFTVEPPYLVEFYNTNGAEVPCSAHGRPSPHVSWVRRVGSAVSDIPGLRHLRPNGSLVFLPFGPEDYRQDIHASVYRCVASNIVGTVGSRDVHVRAGKPWITFHIYT